MSPSKPPNRALRLLFEYEGDNVKLVSVQRLNMKAPPPQAPPPDTPGHGAWFELRDAQGKSMYRRGIHDLLSGDLEVLSDHAERPLARVRPAQKRGVFYLVVPDIPEARSVALNSIPVPGAGAAKGAELKAQVHQFDLPGQGPNQGKEGR